MPTNKRKAIPPDSLQRLRQQLDQLPPRSSERTRQVASFGDLYGISLATGHLEKLPCFMESEKFPFDFIGKIFALLSKPDVFRGTLLFIGQSNSLKNQGWRIVLIVASREY
ncbi:MAG: hypothetical protein FWF12_11810 [Betaproteobacteria bacterium]|nr:hypothetical protein [Betaproteobacteria bacterium]